MKRTAFFLSALTFLSLVPAARAHAASCETVATLNLPNVKVTSAAEVAPGAFVPPGPAARGGGAGAFSGLPTFCRVAATLTPSADSDIKIEVWLPTSGWNGKFQSVGNGGWNGNIDFNALASGVRRGYATASTDTGHQGRRRVLQQPGSTLVLRRMLRRRPPGPDSGPALP